MVSFSCESCISEDQKYQGALYKNKKVKAGPNTPAKSAEPTKMNISPYVEDVPEDVPDYADYEDNSDDDNRSPIEPHTEAPTPPAAPEGVNVFDFLVASDTPNASTLNFPHQVGGGGEETQLVRYDHEANACELEDELVNYGTGPIPTGPYETPAPKASRKKTKEGSEIKTDKKRKRLHIETDHIMTDAPPVLHSGLTGGLNRLMKPVFPPSPDYSGGDAPLTSPIKKSKKHSKSSRHETTSIGNNLLSMVSSGVKSSKTKKKSSSKKHKSRHEKGSKLIEYKPSSRDGSKDGGDSNQMVVFKPRADLFLSYVTKGPESERGCSMNKALKRYHRERSNSGESLTKVLEEKELWKSLRLRRNERGEIVVFGL
ncbi:related to cell growth regulating nucleolar protein LYAR [Cephalotrichum gorgonifer]|uniref:Related to cell growth regulating nucleolar protein LYAR n=1 Tax=Cephalotrichum gorgonifer TaxID=2041049 RepID=A0AAE8MV14_9PEZI|nr:related to cell growth regulating nucleolar protein LYAR [Cephalotrichum gorgonifer]